MATISVSDRLEQLLRSDRRKLERPAFLIPYKDKIRLIKELMKMDKQLAERREKDQRAFRNSPVYPAPDGVISEYELD
jgi:hypothetical protein